MARRAPHTPATKSPKQATKHRLSEAPPALQQEPLSPLRPGAAPGLPEPIESEKPTLLATGAGAAYHRLRSSMHDDSFSRYEGNTWPAVPINESDAKGLIEMKPPQLDELAILPAEGMEALAGEMWEQTRELSQLEAHMLDALSHVWIKQASHPEARAVVAIDELLSLRGLKPKKSGSGRRGGFEPEQRREILQALSRIRNLWLSMDELATYTDNGGKTPATRKEMRRFVAGPAFAITGLGGQARLDGGLDVDSVSFTPGDVLGLFLWGPGRQTAIIDAKILQLNHYTQESESLLARYLSWLWKVRATKGTYSEPLRVSTLLKEVRLELNDKKPSLTLKRLEKLLDTLQREGIIRSWRYKSWSLDKAPARGWGEPWLQELVIIEPPEHIVNYYRDNLRGALPDGKPAPLDERLKETRSRLGLTQAQASEDADITQQAYSRAERGKGVSSTNQSKLETWLSTHEVSKPESE